MRIPPFELERWLRANEAKARFPIGGSGVARADLAPFLPERAELARLWQMHPDDATRAVQAAIAQEYGVDASEVLVAAGASEADQVAVLGLAGPGERVVVEEPAYHALLAPALAVGCRVVRARRDPERGFALDVGAMAEAFRDGAKLALLARPNNPTGAVVPDRDLVEVAEAAERAGGWVVVDEVFADATALGDRPARLLHPRIISVNSLTKCLGFGPLRVGWLVAHRDAQEALDRAKAVATVANPLLGLALAPRILEKRKELLRATRAKRAEGAEVVAKSGLDAVLLEHGTTCVARVGDDVAKARAWLEEGALVSPGSFIELPGWIRIGLVGDAETLRDGLERLGSR